MGLKILVAMDDSDNAMRAVEQTAALFDKSSSITLLSIFKETAAICELNSPELTPLFNEQRSSFCQLEDRRKEIIQQAQRRGMERLVEAGFRKEEITLKAETQRRGVARDIIDEANNGYDVIVLGRRGLSGLKEFFMGSVSQKVLSGAKDLSVLLVN